ncbi:MAG: phosphoribosylglycinamide formyltransferase [Endomicrobiales bacterium]|nr:phosphoribosylglycinamide formyltransferase [Endomicrobiales bacterium]
MKRIGVLVSGGGSNLEAIIEACKNGVLKDIAQVYVVISNKSDAYALQRAKNNNIAGVFVDRKKFTTSLEFSDAILQELMKYKVDLVCLAGFMQKIETNLINVFKGKILNIHPALLPKFGGKGMHGRLVHEAVIAAKESKSGATVHLVDEHYDHGKIVAQIEVPVLVNDTPQTLAQRVLKVEHDLYPKAIKIILEDK